MASSGGSGLSFGFSKTSKKSSVLQSSVKIDDSKSSRRGRRGSDAEDDETTVEEIGNTVLDPRSDRSAPRKEYVIPLIRRGKSKAADSGSGDGGDAAGSSKKCDMTREMTDLEKQAVAELSRDAEEADANAEDDRSVPILMQNRLDKADKDELGDVSTLDEYDNMPVEFFGKAMLRGMGWKPGVGVGKTNKKVVHPVEFISRSRGRGLGADAANLPEKLPEKVKPRRLKPGEVRKKEVELPTDADGRIRHYRRVGEVLEEKEDLDLAVGSRCLVVSGRHKGLYGKAVSMQIEPPRVVIAMAINDESVDVSQLAVRVVPRREYEQKALSIASDGEDDDVNDRRGDEDSHGEKQRVSSKDRGRDGTRNHSPWRGDRNSRPIDDSDLHGKHKKAKKAKKHKHRKEESPSEDDSRRHHVVPWLASQIRVRMIDKRYDGGRRYNTKLVINDVTTPTTCTCNSESGTFLDNLDQSMLETVIPKEPMAPVRVVAGQHRHELGRILSRDKATCRALIQLYPDFETVQCNFDEICEYVGRVDHL